MVARTTVPEVTEEEIRTVLSEADGTVLNVTVIANRIWRNRLTPHAAVQFVRWTHVTSRLDAMVTAGTVECAKGNAATEIGNLPTHWTPRATYYGLTEVCEQFRAHRRDQVTQQDDAQQVVVEAGQQLRPNNHGRERRSTARVLARRDLDVRAPVSANVGEEPRHHARRNKREHQQAVQPSSRNQVPMDALKKHARITGETRDKLGADLRKKYEKGASIRQLMEKTGRSYGFVHRVLNESGATLRGRGGNRRTAGIKGSAK